MSQVIHAKTKVKLDNIKTILKEIQDDKENNRVVSLHGLLKLIDELNDKVELLPLANNNNPLFPPRHGW